MGYLLVGKQTPDIFLWLVAAAFVVVSAVVFIHTFVIAKYRVALDYKKNEVVLRYMFSKITIPFDSFDARDGEPDRATAMLKKSTMGANMKHVGYLILDNVYEEVCYQTSSKDLATQEDFDMLSKEAKLIASVYKAKEKYDALKTDEEKEVSSDDITNLVHDIMKEDKAEKAQEELEKKEEAIASVAAEEAEAASEKVEEVKEAVEDAAEKAADEVADVIDEEK